MMGNGVVTVRCACGWETTGSEGEVIAATTDHGRKLHNMTPTREQILAMAIQPADAVEASDAAPAGQ
jgi:predicted small metal-binding protein